MKNKIELFTHTTDFASIAVRKVTSLNEEKNSVDLSINYEFTNHSNGEVSKGELEASAVFYALESVEVYASQLAVVVYGMII